MPKMDFVFCTIFQYNFQAIPKVSRISRDIPGSRDILGYPDLSRLIPLVQVSRCQMPSDSESVLGVARTPDGGGLVTSLRLYRCSSRGAGDRLCVPAESLAKCQPEALRLPTESRLASAIWKVGMCYMTISNGM